MGDVTIAQQNYQKVQEFLRLGSSQLDEQGLMALCQQIRDFLTTGDNEKLGYDVCFDDVDNNPVFTIQQKTYGYLMILMIFKQALERKLNSEKI